MTFPSLKNYLLDAHFLILLFFLLRLYGITNPPLERNHNWRQATTNMYARNFLETDNNILYGRVDMAGDLSGITAKEFPLFNYLIYLVAEVFGWEHWYGRLISLVVSSFGVWFFFLLIRKYIDQTPAIPNPKSQLALPATFILLCSIWFGHSRIIMPDTFSVSLVLSGLYFALEYLYGGRRLGLLLFFLLGTAGALSKLPSGFLFSVLLIPLFQKSIPAQRKGLLAVAGAALLGTCGWWYFYWLPHIIQNYGYEHYPMRSFREGAEEIFADLPETFERFYVSGPKGFVAFGLYLLGVFQVFWKRNRLLMLLFALLSFFFFLYMLKAGATFYRHNYYIIPFAPVMAFFAAYGWASFRKRWLRSILLLAVAAEGIGNQQDAFHVSDKEKYKLTLENIADSVSQRNNLVAFNSDGMNPQELYFAHRKGWIATNAQLLDAAYRKEIRVKGCEFIFINKEEWKANPPLPEKPVYEDEHYLVYRLQ